jgi:hypothetical protein
MHKAGPSVMGVKVSNCYESSLQVLRRDGEPYGCVQESTWICKHAVRHQRMCAAVPVTVVGLGMVVWHMHCVRLPSLLPALYTALFGNQSSVPKGRLIFDHECPCLVTLYICALWDCRCVGCTCSPQQCHFELFAFPPTCCCNM